MPLTKFNVVEEFCTEIENDAPEIDRGIVRITGLDRRSSSFANTHSIFAVASYSVKGEIVILESYCGEVWGINKEMDQKVFAREKDIRDAVARTCDALGLKKRAGILEK
ncbi:MAG: hypothetical protein WC551_09770 [Patescibacteria group bacterium]